MTHSQKISWAVTYSALTVFSFALFFFWQDGMQFFGASSLTFSFWLGLFAENMVWGYVQLAIAGILFIGIIAAPICVACGREWPLLLLMAVDIVGRVVNIVYKQFYVVGDMEMLVPGLVTAIMLLLVTVWRFRQPVKAETEAL